MRDLQATRNKSFGRCVSAVKVDGQAGDDAVAAGIERTGAEPIRTKIGAGGRSPQPAQRELAANHVEKPIGGEEQGLISWPRKAE